MNTKTLVKKLKSMMVARQDDFDAGWNSAIKSTIQEIEAAQPSAGGAKAATLSGLYNCQVCGEEKCPTPGICEDCLTPPGVKHD